MTGRISAEPRDDYREVVIGKNSRVWRSACVDGRVGQRFGICISHTELHGFAFTRQDRVWVFAYSRRVEENSRLLEMLSKAGVREIVYVSTATTIVTRFTHCYSYPRVKLAAENQARHLTGARVLTLGVVYERAEELPAGPALATSQDSIKSFLLEPVWDVNGDRQLFELVSRPFTSRFEAALHQAYGTIIGRVRRWPCVLRPLDLLLRLAGIRWYGYIYLSTQVWIATRS